MFKFDGSTDNIMIHTDILNEFDRIKLLNFVETADFDYQGTKEKTLEELEIEKNIYKQYQKDLPDEIKNILQNIFTSVKEQIEKKYGVEFEHRIEDEGSNSMFINKWKKNIHMNAHYDEEIMSDFNLSIIYYLNDDYDGGELHFPQHNLKIKPIANSTISFPGNENYYHEVLEVFGKNRYTASAWFKFANREGGK
jgi:predicted 2-oxoglutarate/Fe(II)-dependent dioxygenase YbiX